MEYELVREIQNLCPNNQMRDVFFDEIQTDDPETYAREFLGGKATEVSVHRREDGVVSVFANCDGLIQKFIFTPF